MATTKLTDAQRVILAGAAARDSGHVLPTPKSLGDNRGTLSVILKSLLTRGLVTERPILPDEEPWRDTAELGRTTLVISAKGLQVMGIEPSDHVGQEDAVGDDIVVGDGDPSPLPRPPFAGSGTAMATPGSDAVAPAFPREGTKLDALIAALRKPEGATIPQLMQATGWQAHSVRGAMSGNLKKKLKLEVTSEVIENRGRVYRVAK